MLLTEKQLEERVHALLPLGYVEIAKGDISLVAYIDAGGDAVYRVTLTRELWEKLWVQVEKSMTFQQVGPNRWRRSYLADYGAPFREFALALAMLEVI